MKEKKHLPLYGIGPILCYPIAVLTAIGIILSVKGIIPGAVSNSIVNKVLVTIGILLIVEGVTLFFGADLNGKLQENIKEN